MQQNFDNYILLEILLLQTQITTDSSNRAKLQSKQIFLTLRVRLRIAYKVLKTLVEVSWDTLDEYIHPEIIWGIESDIDLYF